MVCRDGLSTPSPGGEGWGEGVQPLSMATDALHPRTQALSCHRRTLSPNPLPQGERALQPSLK